MIFLNFSTIGMKTIHDLYGDIRKHNPIAPSETDKQKIVILKEALNLLRPSLKDKHFTPLELDAKVYLFDKNGAAENRMYNNVQAEAITEEGVSKGFWLDVNYLKNSSFSDILETALHELSHKVGGDMSSEFSYELTDVNRDVLEQVISNPDTVARLQALSTIWKTLV